MRCQTDSVQPADSPAEWPFHTVYLWDAQTRLAPLLLLVGAFGSWLTVDMLRWQTFHHSLDVALPWLALFHVLWPLFGPRGAAVRAQLGASWNWHSSLAPWSLRMLGPGHQGLAIRALVLLLALGMAFSAMFSRTWHQGLASVLVLAVVLQMLGQLWVHWRAGDALLPALLHGMGPSRLNEALPKHARGMALILTMVIPVCWGWQEVRIEP